MSVSHKTTGARLVLNSFRLGRDGGTPVAHPSRMIPKLKTETDSPATAFEINPAILPRLSDFVDSAAFEAAKLAFFGLVGKRSSA